MCVCIYIQRLWLSLLAQRVKCLPAVRETWVRFLGGEDPLEKEMATHSSILAWKTPWMEKSDGLPSMELQSQTQLSDFTLIPLQIKRISPESGLTFVAGDSCTLGVFWCNESWSSLVSPF